MLRLIHAYRARGHRIAQVDPLGGRSAYFPELDPAHYGFGTADLDEPCIAGVVSAFDAEGEPVYLGTDQVQVNARHQADIVVAYDIRHALEVIDLNPVGFEIKPA